MIRTCLEFLLLRALDSGKRPAAWLQRRVQRDAQLKQFDAEARQLDSLLRRSAAERRQAMTTDDISKSGDSNNGAALLTRRLERQDTITTARVKTPGRSAAWLTGLAAAAVLLLMAAPSWSPNWFRPSAPAVHAGEFSRQLSVVPGEVLRLISRAAKTSRTQLPQLSPLPNLTLANLTLPALTLAAWDDVAVRAGSPMLQEPLLREIDIWQANWQNLKLRLSAPAQEL